MKIIKYKKQNKIKKYKNKPILKPMLQTMNFILCIFLLLGCGSDIGVPEPDRALPLTGKLKQLALYEGSAARYVLNNPVEEGIVFEPQDYKYSSAVDYCGKKGMLNNICIFVYFEI